MIRYRIAAFSLALPILLSAPAAHAQRVLPLDPPVVLPPVSARELRDAERVTRRPEEKRQDASTPVAGDNPGLGYDVTTGIQQRALEKALHER